MGTLIQQCIQHVQFKNLMYGTIIKKGKKHAEISPNLRYLAVGGYKSLYIL